MSWSAVRRPPSAVRRPSSVASFHRQRQPNSIVGDFVFGLTTFLISQRPRHSFKRHGTPPIACAFVPFPALSFFTIYTTVSLSVSWSKSAFFPSRFSSFVSLPSSIVRRNEKLRRKNGTSTVIARWTEDVERAELQKQEFDRSSLLAQIDKERWTRTGTLHFFFPTFKARQGSRW